MVDYCLYHSTHSGPPYEDRQCVGDTEGYGWTLPVTTGFDYFVITSIDSSGAESMYSVEIPVVTEVESPAPGEDPDTGDSGEQNDDESEYDVIETVVSFDDPRPPGSTDSLVSGEFEGIDFGDDGWRWSGPYRLNATNQVYFDGPGGNSRTFGFVGGARRLVSVKIYSQDAGTLTIRDALGQTVTRALESARAYDIATGWSRFSQRITVSYSAGWRFALDDIRLEALVAAPPSDDDPDPPAPETPDEDDEFDPPVSEAPDEDDQDPVPPSDDDSDPPVSEGPDEDDEDPAPGPLTEATVTFDDPAPPGSPNAIMARRFEGIEFEDGGWRWSGPYASNSTNHIYFDRVGVSERSFRFREEPALLASVTIHALENGVLTLTDDRGQEISRTLSAGQVMEVATGWSTASRDVTVRYSAGWTFGLDDIRYAVSTDSPDPEDDDSTGDPGSTAPELAPPVSVSFDGPIPEGAADSFIENDFVGIDFGSGQWRWSGPYGPNASNSIYFDHASVTSRRFEFTDGPALLESIAVYALTGGTLTLSDDEGQEARYLLVADEVRQLTTGWDQPSSRVTVSFSAGWNFGVDDIVYLPVVTP